AGARLDPEQLWDASREAVVRETGGRWRDDATLAMIGMSSPEWSAYMRDELGVPMDRGAISREVVQRLEAAYRRALPLLPGAAKAVRALAARWPLGLASSADRQGIALV